MMKKILPIILFSVLANAQVPQEEVLKQIYAVALTQAQCYAQLDYLSNQIGPRLSGSANAEKAVQYTKQQMEDSACFDRVWLQEVMVPQWVRGEKESAYFKIGKSKTTVPICALGNSIATAAKGLEASVVEVHSIAELESLGAEKLNGKIVFYNRPMDPLQIDAFNAYGSCVDQRVKGAREAAKFGAVAVIVRSMNLRLDNFPHTGVVSYGDLPQAQYIPAAAISTNAAELLSQTLKKQPDLKFFFKQSCYKLPDVLSYNVIGEIKGVSHPENIMVVGGHLDSWDLADGAQDDGAGVVQSIEVAHLFKSVGYKPNNTLRVVLFMNEENGGKGGDKYNEMAQVNDENHVFALESDCGGFTPRGFTFEADDRDLQTMQSYEKYFEPYLIHLFKKGHGGSDITPIKSQHIIKAGLRPDTQRYFDYHHAANDNFDAVNKRELELGAAAMASLLYLYDQNYSRI